VLVWRHDAHPQRYGFWLDDFDDLHHPEILMVDDVAMEHELADIVGVAGIDVDPL
jgi:hypothetical protein